MKKSPLSTPGNANNFHRGRGHRRGYVYRQGRNDNDNYHGFNGFNNSAGNQFGSDMIPLSTSSPKFHHNPGERQQFGDLRNQRFSSTGISGSYNQRDNFQNSPPYIRDDRRRPPRFPRNNNWRQDKEEAMYRKLPISEFFDLESASEDPWAELERQLEMHKSAPRENTINDSSVEIISEHIANADSSLNCSSDESTINISSSYDENKQGSSVDLPLESMNFSQTSSDVVLLSSQSDDSLNESGN